MHQNENWGVCDIKYVVVWVLLKLCPKPFYKSLTVSYLYNCNTQKTYFGPAKKLKVHQTKPYVDNIIFDKIK